MNAPEGPVSPEEEQDERIISPILPLPGKISNLRNLVAGLQGIICLEKVPGNITLQGTSLNAGNQFLTDDEGNILTDDSGNPILAF